MKLKDLFDVLPTTEYIKIFSQEAILQFKGRVSEYIGNGEEKVFTIFSCTTYDASAYTEIILDYEEDKND